MVASADHLATLWTFDAVLPANTPTATLRLPHPYYVKTILSVENVFPASDTHCIFTGSTDEQIRVWDLSLLDSVSGIRGDPKAAKKSLATTAVNASEAYSKGKKPQGLVYELEGHVHEVIKLGLWSTREEEESSTDKSQDKIATKFKQNREEVYLISAGLDCTVRKWRLRDVLARGKVGPKGETEKVALGEEETSNDMRVKTPDAYYGQAITADEEAELAELMDGD